jgi:uncharacterized protein (DUF3820 family)
MDFRTALGLGQGRSDQRWANVAVLRHHAQMPDSKAPGAIVPPTPTEPDNEALLQIARMRMPFGRYAGTRLIDLPEPYVVWFKKKGFPRGRLGMLLATLYEIKANGLEPLLASLRERGDPSYRNVDPRKFREGDR